MHIWAGSECELFFRDKGVKGTGSGVLAPVKARRLARQGVCSELGVARRGLVWPESRADAKLKNRLCQANKCELYMSF